MHKRVKLGGLVKGASSVLLSCSCSVSQTLCDPMDCSPPGSSVHGFSRQEYCSRLPFPPPGIFPTQGSNPGFLHCSHQGGPSVLLRSLNFLLGGKSLQQEAECWNWVILPQAAWSPVCRGRGIRRGDQLWMTQRRPSRWVFVPRQGGAGKKDRMTARAGCLLSREKLELGERNQRDWENFQSCKWPMSGCVPFWQGPLGAEPRCALGQGTARGATWSGGTPLSAHPACWPRKGHQKRKRKVLSLLVSRGGR